MGEILGIFCATMVAIWILADAWRSWKQAETPAVGAVLVDYEIQKAIGNGDFGVSNYDSSLINPASLDFLLGSTFGQVKATGTESVKLDGVHYSVINPQNKGSFFTELKELDEYILMPGEFIIATTQETFTFGPRIAGTVKGKSSMGRIALVNSSPYAGWIDPGFSAPITLELSNLGSEPIKLTPGMKIGQLVLFKTSLPRRDYSKTGRYQGQKAGQGSKGV